MTEPQPQDLPALDALIKDPKIRRIFAAAALQSFKLAQKASEKTYIEVVSRFSAYET